MILNLYGDNGLVFQALATGFKEAHVQDKLKFDVVEADKVGAKFKEAVKKAYNAKFLDDADMVIRFAEIKQAAPEDEEKVDVDAEVRTDDGEEDVEVDASAEEKKEVSEAESTAQGVALKKKIIDTVRRCLYQADDSNVELSDLPDYVDGYDVSFLKVSLKEGESSVAG